MVIEAQNLRLEFENGRTQDQLALFRVKETRRHDFLVDEYGRGQQACLTEEFGEDAPVKRRLQPVASSGVKALLNQGKIEKAAQLSQSLPRGAQLREIASVLAPPKFRFSKRQEKANPALDYNWLRENYQDFCGQWVALKNGQLQRSADSLRELVSGLSKHEISNFTLVYQVDDAHKV